MKSIILQVEEKSPVKNETMMSDLIYCKLIINDYLNSSDFSEKEYVDLCKIGLNLNTNIKMKYRIATCYLKFLCKHSCSFEEFEKAGQYTLGILKDSGCSDDWYTHVIIGKFHQDIGIILGNLTLKCDDQNKIFKLAYQHFNDGLSIFNLYKLYYNKAFLIVDYIKVIYCHLFYNKIWSKNLLLICLSLIKESHLALDYYKNNPDFTDIIETTEFKNCVDLITILEIELYIIINKFENITLYDTNDSIKHMISNYIIDSYIPTEINEKYEFIKNISIEEAKNICLSLKEYLNKSNSKNIHILFLYGIIQCLNPEKEEQSVVDLNNIIFKKTLKIGDYYNKEQKNNDSLIKSTSCFLDLKLSSDEEEYFMKFFNNWDLSLLNSITEKYEHPDIKIENDSPVEMKQNNDVEPKIVRRLSRLESSINILPPTSTKDKKPLLNDEKTKQDSVVSTLQQQENKSFVEEEVVVTSIGMIECFKNVISIGLASVDYQYVQLCSEYLYKLTNEDLSLKFGYLSLLQNCIYSNTYKELLLKTTSSHYKYSYIKNILKEQNNCSKEYYIQNNITLGWKRYIINKNYLTSFKSIPKGIDILILQHSLDKKILYTGLINKEGSQGKGKEGSIHFDFLEYAVNYEEWKSLIRDFNSIIEEYEIDSNILDYVIKKEYFERKEAAAKAKAELEKQETIKNMNEENENEKSKTKQEKKKNKKNKKLINEDSYINSDVSLGKNINMDINSEMNEITETKIKEKIPENILSLFQNYLSRIINYLSPIFEHYKKVNKSSITDKKKKKDTNNISEKEEKTKYNLIICCDESFLILPLSLIFNHFSSWDIIYKEFSYNMLLHRYKEQFSSEKESQQSQDFAEVNYLNCMVNFDKDNYAKKDKSELNDIQINNINELKNILSINNILNKWPGSYFTKIQTAQLEHFFSPPGFLYMSYNHLFDEIPFNKFNFNLSGINHAIIFENISISKFKTRVYKLDIKETVQTMMLLSLYGINNIYYQPYLVDLDTNKILLDTIF
eukprot:jgi/Orpsp1_1/1190224/evm.model.d7180000077567.1